MTSYRDLQQYVEKLNEVLQVMPNFKELKHRHDADDSKDYLMMSTVVGNVFMFDITGKSKSQIFHIMAQVNCQQKPDELILDRQRLLALGRKFNK